MSELPAIDQIIQEGLDLVRSVAGAQDFSELDKLVLDLAPINPLIPMVYHLGRMVMVRDECRASEVLEADLLAKITSQLMEREGPSDNCEICYGRKGGVRGNENVEEGVVVCDYCSVQIKEGTLEGDELLSWELHRNNGKHS